MTSIKRTELEKALQHVMPGVDSSELLEQSASVVFAKNIIYTYNEEVSVSYPLISEIDGATRFGRFLKVIQKTRGEEIQLIAKKPQIIIKSGDMSVGLNMEETTLINPLLDAGELSWEELPTDFLDGLRFCLFSASKDFSQGVLSFLRVFDKYIVSCDNYRITKYSMESSINGIMLLPASAVRYLVQFNNVVQICKRDAWIHFRNTNGTIFSCITVEDTYPPTDEILSIESNKAAVLPPNLMDILERACVFSSELVTISVQDSKLVCRAEDNGEWFEEVTNMSYDKDPFVFSINPKMLGEILKHTNRVRLGENRFLFAGKKFQHVVALCRSESKK